MNSFNYETWFKAFPTIDHNRNRYPFKKGIRYNLKVGEITPVCTIPVVPGQTLNLDISTIMRTSPLSVPPMDDIKIKWFAFVNYTRNTWENYPYWFGEKKNPENPEQEPTYIFPKVWMPEGGFAYNGFYDNIGCNPAMGKYWITADIPRGDRAIYNTFFRNQSLENPLEINYGDEDDDYEQNAELRKICKPRDYFTQMLPNVSGTEGIEIPLGTEAPVIQPNTNGPLFNVSVNQSTIGRAKSRLYAGNNGDLFGTIDTAATPNLDTGLKADLSKAIGAPLETLYQAIAYNTMQYITSRGGNRYFERLSNIYGVVNPDNVLRLPEFLGTQETEVEFDTVTQTSNTTGQSQGPASLTSNGYVENYGSLINKSFGEFGTIYIYAVATYHGNSYQQGIPRHYSNEDPLDLFNPIFNRAGDEPIYYKELFVQSNDVVDEEGTPINEKVAGYGKRNGSLLYPVNEVHGEQRSTYEQSLDANHFAYYFEELPVLNKDFDKVTDEPFRRALQVQDEIQFLCHSLITGTNDIEVPINAIPSPIPDVLTKN